MANFYLVVADAVGPGKHRVGGGKTLADAKRNAGRVLKKSSDITTISITDESGKEVETVTAKDATPPK